MGRLVLTGKAAVRPWGEASEAEYRDLSLLAHRLLADVPVHDVWHVLLPDSSHRPCSMGEVRRVALGLVRSDGLGRILPGLFGVRRRLGALFGWDKAPPWS